ncbi:proprotein convertase P-domain-containing protein [Flavobacterium sp.]|uniref:proprotein convertase P-domain-containing protein n=1 Tax=Flavobacterium sp. TaxID=239 RepID=UPI0025BFCA8F|nr:proprotein convertase P-domain-containing protein [Flavobacterium sp.]
MKGTLLRFCGNVFVVLLLMLFGSKAFAQTTVFRFDFENTVVASVDNAVGTPTFTANVPEYAYDNTSACLNTNSITSANVDTGAYYQFTVNATGYSNLVFSYCDRVNATGNAGTVRARASLDGTTWTNGTIYSAATTFTTRTLTLPATFNNASNIIIQIYKVTDDTNGFFSGGARTYYVDNCFLTDTAAKPIVTSLSTYSSCPGSTFNITGSGFTGITGVTVNGAAVASYTVNSATSISATLAAGNTAGNVRVTNAAGTGVGPVLAVNPVTVSATATPATICVGSSSALASSVTTLPGSPTGNNTTAQTIADLTTVYSAITIPSTCATAAQLTSMTVNVTHTYNSDLELYLSSPYGQMIPLITKKGGSGDNIVATLQAGGTALPTGNVTINGTYTPETAFSTLTGNATGIWTLVVSDNVANDSGTFNSWSMTFTSTCGNVTYSWSPATGLSSTTSANPSANPTTSQTYTLTATNGTGCTASTTVGLTVNPLSVGGTVNSSATVCAPTNTGTLNLVSNVGNVIRWESSTNNFATITSISNTTTSLTYTNLSATTAYRAIVQSGICATATSSVATITVTPASVGGTTSGAATVCAPTNTGTITLGSNVGSVIGWESSLDNFATAGTPIANTTTSLTYSNLSATTSFRAIVQNGTCATANSTATTITVTPASAGGTVNSSASVCFTSNTGTLNLTGNIGNVIRWESSTNNFATVTSISNTTTSLTYTNLTVTTSFRAVVQSGTCATANSTAATITVTPASVGGTVGTSATVCAPTNTGTLNLTGNVGNVIGWQSSTDNFATFTAISNTTTSLTYTNLATTTSYRAVVQSGTCATANSTAATITVTPASVGGTVGTSATVCAPTNTGTLNLTGNVGNVIGWQSSTDNFATFTAISNTTTSLTYTNLATTTSYRAVVQSGTCTTANSTAATITVTPASVGGTVGTSATVCAPTNTGTLNLTGNVGNVIGWQSSTDNFATFTAISNTTTSLTYTNLATTTSYRAVVQNGTCATANSTAATITVTPASVGGTVGTSATVCAPTNTGILNLTGNVGNVIGWQSSTDNFATFTAISNTTTSLTYTNLATTTSYRAVVQSGTCTTANSTAATITVTPASVGGTVGTSATVCAPTNSGTLNLTGNVGNVIRWESSTDNFTTVNSISNTTTSLTYTNLATTTSYRAVVQSGTCTTANSTAATITVTPASVGGTVGTSATVCASSNSGTLTLTGNVGNVIGWQSSTDNFATFTAIANTTTSLTYTNISVTTSYRAIVQSGSCATATSSAATITVSAVNVGGTLSGNATFCSHTNSGTLTLTGYTGTQLSWEYSFDNFATAGIPFVNSGATYNYSNVSQTTYYRVAVSNAACPVQYSSVAVVSVNNNSTWTGNVDTNWHVAGNWTCNEVPQNYTVVTIPSATNQPIIGADAFAYSITMASSTTLLLTSGNDLTVTDAILSQGTFTAENNSNLIQINNVANTGISKVKRNSSALIRQDYTLWSSPVSGQNLQPFSPLTLATRFYTYNVGINQYNTIAAPATTLFDSGVGYLIRTPNNHPTTPTIWSGEFTGVLHNGNVTVPLTNIAVGQRFNAVGNPYPSSIDMQTFVSNNSSNITGTLYFWRKTNNPVSPSYCSWTSGGGFVANGEAQVFDPQGIIRTGQGFFVEASASGSQVTFNNGQRSGDNANQFFRSANTIERHRVWLNATGANNAFCQTLVGYIEGSTMDNDAQIDGRFFNDGEISFYSMIGQERFVIQGRPLPFVDTDVVPMGFKATTAGTFQIAIDHKDGLFEIGQDVFVRDNTTGTVHDLNTGAYSFASDAGVFNSRFEILYQNPLQTQNPVFNDNSVIVYKDKENFVVNSGNMNMASIKVYDVLGKLVKEIKDINATQAVFTVGGSNQMLIFKIYSAEKQEVIKKVAN